jgi:hypothetical protein
MTAPPLVPGFDGLMTLSRREGVDIRPTLLRVLTDLYVQTNVHNADEERQFVELASRLIDQVDDSTRAAVRARLSIYPNTPAPILQKLALRPQNAELPAPRARPIEKVARAFAPPLREPTEAQLRATGLSMQPDDAAQINAMFFAATARERALILHNLFETPLKPAARIYPPIAERAVDALQMAAFAIDAENFTRELGEVLILSQSFAQQVVNDPGGEPLACALKALGMPSAIFQRVLMFLDPAQGASVNRVYRLSRLFDKLEERTALIMLAAWRGATIANTRARYRPALYDDERHRARAAQPQARPLQQPGVPLARPTRGSGS